MSTPLRIVLAWTLAACAVTARADALADLVRGVETRDVAAVTRLLQRGMDASSVDLQGNPLLVLAARGGDLDMVRLLVDQRAKVNVRNRFGETPIMAAAYGGHLPVVRFLRERGAEINHEGWTPLLYAAAGGHDAVVEYLLRSGASLDTAAPNGVTPLMMAVRGVFPSTVDLLLEHGSDPNARSQDGATALGWARARGLDAIAARLRRAGAYE